MPVQTEYFALEGLAGLLETLALVQRELNPRLTVAGMLLTMHDGRTRLGQDVEREVRAHFPDLVFDTVIPRNVRVGEAPSHGLPVTHHDPHSAGRRRTSSLQRRWPRVARPKPGMGRGLSAILSVSSEGPPQPEEELRELPVELIAPNPRQPRREFDEEALEALAGSLGEQGVLQPVLVRPRPVADTSSSPASGAGGRPRWRGLRPFPRSSASARTPPRWKRP